MGIGFSADLGYTDENIDTQIDEMSETLGTKTGTNTTKNSGRTDTSKNTTNGTTTGTNITTGNTTGTNITGTDASVNTSTSTTSGGRNTTGTNASVNTTVQGGSTSTTSNSGSTNTSQLIISQEGIDNIIKGILEGTQGLASQAKGANNTGGYNSTTAMLLTNDLVARTAGEVAERTAKRVDTIGGSSSTTTNSGFTTTQNIGATTGFQDIGGMTTTATQNVGATKSTTSMNGTNTSNTAVNNTNSSTTDILNIIGESSSSTDILEKLASRTNTARHEEKDREQTEVKTGGKAGWILCTELYRQDRMPKKYYVHGAKAFSEYDERSKRGYYYWAVPALKHLRAHPYSRLSKFLCTMLNARAEYLSAEAKCKGARKTVLGFIAKNLYWGCWILSRTVARNYTFNTVPLKGDCNV